MSIFFIFVIVGCFAIIGYKLASYYINRKKFFSSLQTLLSGIELDIAFSKDKLKNLIKRNTQKLSSTELVYVCDKVCSFLENKQTISNSIFNDISILKKDEKQFVYQIFFNLGKYDSFLQTKEIQSYLIKIDEYYNVANEECKKYAGLFIKLGIIVGLLVCLLII